MGFAFYFFVAWLITIIFTLMRKRLTFVENASVFLLILIISINWSWIIYNELNLIKLTAKPLPYTAFLINRSIGIPFIIVITLNLIKAANSKGKSILIACLSTVTLVILIQLGKYFDIVTPIKWNILYDVLYIISLHLIGWYSLKFIQKLKQSEAMSQ
ncbi:hypothetical protein [Neobacillus cucumis]|jgi:hypothetical protein|uniref:hypothetical protein n=1 Tax=Neobacillus cucumis TaxID=1740721 RepID=UPI002E1CACF9|nr:hypothetical protein [Neobacillus cucumis]